jgi:hypothetical protein
MSLLLDDLEEMKKKLNAAVRWNFGRVANDVTCNARLDDVHRLEERLKINNPDEYLEYQNKYY